MADTQVFVSHAPGDYDRVTELVGPLRNLPIDVYVAGEAVDPDRSRSHLRRRLGNSDIVVVAVTDTAVDDPWVNQEIGYATAEGITLIPLVSETTRRHGYIEDVDPVTLTESDPEVTVYELLSRLREELEPLGELTTPNWFLSFGCTRSDCSELVILDIERRQHELWKQYQHGNTLTAECRGCHAQYEFNPATLGFIERIDP